MTVNSSANSVILILFAFSDNISAEISNCLRSSITSKPPFRMYGWWWWWQWWWWWFIYNRSCVYVCLYVCNQKAYFLYSRDLVNSHVYRHIPYSKNLVVSPVSRHFPYLRDLVISPVSRHFWWRWRRWKR